MCAHVKVCALGYRCPQRPVEGTGTSRAEVPGGCGACDMSAGH